MDQITAKSLLAALPLPTLLIDTSYLVTMANPAAVDLFGNDPTGLNAVNMLRQAPVLAAMDGAVREGRTGDARFILSRMSGEIAYRFRARPLQPDRFETVLLSFEDDSHLDEAELIRRDFVANISHELRTPLTGLIGFIETLRTTARDDPEVRERFLAIMETEARRMGRMVADLLSLSRVETDERVRPRDRVDVGDVVRSAVATLGGKLAEEDVQIALSGFDVPQQIMGDRDQLMQLFLNLMENAVKYAGRGKTVHITATRIGRDPTLRLAALRIDTRDEGEGIDPVHLPRLTERFYRVDDHRSREMGGTGLGLAIVKHIVNRHRGRLKITSEQGVGSVFSIVLPLP